MAARYCLAVVMMVWCCTVGAVPVAGSSGDAGAEREVVSGLRLRAAMLARFEVSCTVAKTEGGPALQGGAMGQAANGPAAIGPLLRTVRYRYDVVVDGTRSLSRRSTSDGRGGSDSVVYNDEAMSWTCSSQPTVATPAIAAISGPDPRLAAQTMGPALYLAGALGAPTGESWFSLLAAQPFTAARDACVGEPAVRVTYVPDARAGLEAYVWFIPAKGWAVGAVRMPIDRNYQAQGSVAEWARVGGLWYAKRWIGSSVARPGTALAKEPFNVE